MSTFTRALGDLAAAQKARSGVSLYSRFVNRPLGRVLAAACYTAGMTPNAVTAASAVVTAVGVALLVAGPPEFLRGLAVAALLVLGFALDSADGQVARLTGRGSLAGEWLDHVVDAAKIAAVHGAVLAVVLRMDIPQAWVAVPLAFLTVNAVIFFGGELQRLLLLTRTGAAPATRRPSTTRALALLPADYGVLALSFVLLGAPLVFLGVYTALAVANAGIMLLLLVKWFRALS